MQSLARIRRLEKRYGSTGRSSTHCPFCGRPFRPVIATWLDFVRWALTSESDRERYCFEHEAADDPVRESRERPWREIIALTKSRIDEKS